VKIQDNKHGKRCSASLTIRETQIKTTVRHHLTPIHMTVTKKPTSNAGEDAAEPEPSRTVGGKVKWCSHCGKQCGVPQKLQREFPHNPVILLLVYAQENRVERLEEICVYTCPC